MSNFEKNMYFEHTNPSRHKHKKNSNFNTVPESPVSAVSHARNPSKENFAKIKSPKLILNKVDEELIKQGPDDVTSICIFLLCKKTSL